MKMFPCVLLGVVSIAALITGCSSTSVPPEQNSAGQPTEIPEASLAADSSWAAYFDASTSSLAITIYGSSSCPSAAESAQLQDGRIVISTERVNPPNGEPCTADMAPYTSEVPLPAGATAQTFEVKLEGNPEPITLGIDTR